MSVRMISLGKVKLGEYRVRVSFDEEKMEALKASIKRKGNSGKPSRNNNGNRERGGRKLSKGVRFAVITKASLKPSEDAGNWADELAVINEQEAAIYIGADADEKDKVIGPTVPFTISVKGKSYNMEYIRVPVFQEGEILIIDKSGREIAGLGRKPSKWSVEYEVFDNLEDAIKKAIKVSEGGKP